MRWDTAFWRFIFRIAAVLILMACLGAVIYVPPDERAERKAKAARVDERRADREVKSPKEPTPTPPAAAAPVADRTDLGTDALNLAKKVGLWVAIAAAVFFLGIPVLVLVGAALLALGRAVFDWGVEFKEEHSAVGEMVRDGAEDRKKRKEKERLERDREIARLRQELARLERAGEAPLLRSQQTATADPAPEHPPHSLNGSAPTSD